MADETAEIVHRRSEQACTDPTQPLCLGTDVATNEPVTLSRTERFDPILITGQTGTGKTMLCQRLARQQFSPDSSLCYVTSHPIRSPTFLRTFRSHGGASPSCRGLTV